MRRSRDGGPTPAPVTGGRATPFSPWKSNRRETAVLLWILVLLLIIFAVGGGVAVSNLLWLLLVVALIVAIFAFASGRRAVRARRSGLQFADEHTGAPWLRRGRFSG